MSGTCAQSQGEGVEAGPNRRKSFARAMVYAGLVPKNSHARKESDVIIRHLLARAEPTMDCNRPARLRPCGGRPVRDIAVPRCRTLSANMVDDRPMAMFVNFGGVEEPFKV